MKQVDILFPIRNSFSINNNLAYIVVYRSILTMYIEEILFYND